jgi:hypothetical protein
MKSDLYAFSQWCKAISSSKLHIWLLLITIVSVMKIAFFDRPKKEFAETKNGAL